jgi:hypothetical protein
VSTPPPQRTFSLPELMTYGTVRIECIMPDAKTSTGTGFTIMFKNDDGSFIPFIVTNKHVIRGCLSGSFVMSNTNMAEDTRIHRDQRNIRFEANNWIPHPEEDIDLCIAPINPLLEMLKRNNFNPFLGYANMDLIPTEQLLESFEPLEQIIMVGYPIGLWDSVNNLPLLRRGITATHPKMDYKGKPEFLIDAAVYPGSSGSPVYLYESGSININKEIKFGTRIFLLGINYQYIYRNVRGDIKVEDIPTTKTSQQQYAEVASPVNLGVCIKSSKLKEFEPILRKMDTNKKTSEDTIDI